MEYSANGVIGDRTLRRVGGWVDRLAPWALGFSVFTFSLIIPYDSDFVLYLVVFMSAVAAALARRWLWPLFVLAVVAWLGFGLWPAAFVASYYAATRLRRRSHLIRYLVAAFVMWLISVGIGMVVGGYRELVTATFPNALFYWVITIGLPLVIGLWVDARRQMLAGLEERAERLEREQQARAEEARARERARIAREMHDVVAHRVSLMVLHAGVLEMHATDERMAEEASLIRTTGREALANLRDALGVLRSTAAAGDDDGDGSLTPPPVLVDIDGLLEQSRAAGIVVDRYDEGEPRGLPVLVEQTAYRVVQEALTNVHKHAGGADTTVVLRYAPEQLEVVVRNQLPAVPAQPSPLPASGFGLVGLRERVQLTGGRLVAERTPEGGFVVRAELPAAIAEENQ